MEILGQDVPRLGMGCWPIGGPFFAGETPLGYANAEDGASRRTLDAAYDAGLRLFDTAAVYGAGHAERLVGQALKGRDDALVVTKIGIGFDEGTKRLTGDEDAPEDVLPAIERCLKRLDRDRIDIVLLHLNALPIERAEAIFDQMAMARDQGKIRAFGWSTDFPQSVMAMADRDGFIAVQHAGNVFVDTPTIRGVIEEYGLTAMIRSPLAMGVLGGHMTRETVLPADDIRSTDQVWRDYFEDGRVMPKFMDRLDAVRECLQVGGRSLVQGALAWLWTKSPQNMPIPGARLPEQIAESAGALAFGPLPDDVMDEIERLIERDPEGPPRER